MPRKSKTIKFIEKAKLIHGNKYDYSLVEYKNNSIKVKISCIKHGIFHQRPCNHLNGQGCPNCGLLKRTSSHRYNKFIFIEKANLVHNNKYDYSLVNYINSLTKVDIICSTHGIFSQIPSSHLNKIGCPICGGKNKCTTNEFIEKSILIHKNKYDYSQVKYINSKSNVMIICPLHGTFNQMPNSHLMGQGCPKCANKNITTEEFINKVNKVHNDKYDYSSVDYLNNHAKVKIICPIHGEFKQIPNTHLRGGGCPKCGIDKVAIGIMLTIKEFIERANKKHFNKYDYSKTEYNGARNRVIIICPEHGEFKQLPFDHLNGCGCCKCVESNGEAAIRNFLEKNSFKYIKEKIFDGCKDIICLPFDFYLPDFNFLLEYDGIQHFKPIAYFGGKAAFILQQKRDAIKTEYAKASEIKLFRIAYNENIEKKLKEIFGMELVA